MAKVTRVNELSQLSLINDVIHDCFFDLDDIAFDSSSSVLSIRFRRPIRSRALFNWRDFIYSSRSCKDSPVLESYLRIYQVESHSINDKQRVGCYDFNVLQYDPIQKCINVLTNIPIDIRVKVRNLEVAVEETDTLLEPIKQHS